MSSQKTRPYRTKVARRILTLQLPPTTTAFHAHARLVLMAYLYLPHEFERPRLSHNVRKIAAHTGLHTETVKRTRKRLVDLGVLIKVGKRPGKNGLLKDVMTWGPALLDEQPMVASVNEQPTVACVDEQPVVATGESGGPEGPPLHSEQGPPLHSEQPAVACFNEQPAVAVGEESGGLESPPLRLEQPAVACFNEQPAVAVGEESGGPEGPPLPTEAPLVASVDEQPAVARRTRQPRAARTRNRRLPERTQPLTPAEQEGLGALHRFIRRVADARNAPVRILSALRPILEANDPESVWDLVLRRNPHETEDLALLRQSESLWRSQRSGPQAAGNAGSTRPRAQRSPVTMEVTPESASQ